MISAAFPYQRQRRPVLGREMTYVGWYRMSPESQHLVWVAGNAGSLYATAIIGLRLRKRRILTELSPLDFLAAVAVGAIVGRIPSAADSDWRRHLNCDPVCTRLSLPVASLFERGASRRPKPENTRRQRKTLGERTSAIRAIPSGWDSLPRQHGVHRVSEGEYLLFEDGGKVSVVADSARALPSRLDLFRV